MANHGLSGVLCTLYPAILGQCTATVSCISTLMFTSLTAEADFTDNITRSAKIVVMFADIPRCQFLLIILAFSKLEFITSDGTVLCLTDTLEVSFTSSDTVPCSSSSNIQVFVRGTIESNTTINSDNSCLYTLLPGIGCYFKFVQPNPANTLTSRTDFVVQISLTQNKTFTKFDVISNSVVIFTQKDTNVRSFTSAYRIPWQPTRTSLVVFTTKAYTAGQATVNLEQAYQFKNDSQCPQRRIQNQWNKAFKVPLIKEQFI
jgi:hypothetical protein